MRQIPIEDLISAFEKILKKFNYPEKQWETILKVLRYAVLRGNLQYMIQVCAGNFPVYKGKGDPKIIRETPLSMRIDGQDNYGIIVMEQAMRIAIKKANENGFGIVSSFRSAPPGTGPLGYYVEKISQKGLIGFAFSGSSKHVAMQGGDKAVFGSNPIAIGLPTAKDPLVIDFATSKMPVFKVVEASLFGELLVEEGIDSQGSASCEPSAVLKGALLPFGGYKGSALALAVEALVGPLSGGSWIGRSDPDHNWGNLIYAFAPELLIEKEAFYKNMENFIEELHSSGSGILPGERGRRKMQVTLEKGYIEMDERLYQKWTAVFEGDQ